jgi:uncharacterized protein HemX
VIGMALSWFAGTRVGRWCAIAAAVVLALVTFGWSQRRKGRQDARQQQVEADNVAVRKADDAGRDYRAGGDAADKLRGGIF